MQFPMIPLKRQVSPGATIRLPAAQINGRHPDEMLFTEGEPFFHILTDMGIASLFLKAVAANTDEARAFVSKNFINAIDLDALRDVLGHARYIKSLAKVSFNDLRSPKNCSTRSVLLFSPDQNEQRILHLHMIKEPDRFGQWKIYGVEKE